MSLPGPDSPPVPAPDAPFPGDATQSQNNSLVTPSGHVASAPSWLLGPAAASSIHRLGISCRPPAQGPGLPIPGAAEELLNAALVLPPNLLPLPTMSTFGRSNRRRWQDEDDESDDDDILILAGLIEGARRSKRKNKFRGSLSGRHSVKRDVSGGHQRIYLDYFAEQPVYNDKHFRRRYWMSRNLFLRIVAAVESHDEYFRQKPNAVGNLGASPIQKVIAAFRMLAYGQSADSLDDYVRMGESTIIECVKHFVRDVVHIFGEEYLRAPNAHDTRRLMAINNARGFPGMLGFVDCMHWKWENYPTAWKGAYTGHKDGPTMILEAVASQDLWIWHAFFGLPGSLNDLNVQRCSPLFQRLISGTSPKVEYMVNGNKYNMGYYLVDRIYPSWATFVKGF